MAPPSSDPSNRDVARRQNKNAPFKFLLPLIYAPVLPLIRISLRRRPVLRDRVFTVVLAGALAHGVYLVAIIIATLFVFLSGWYTLLPYMRQGISTHPSKCRSKA